MPDAGRAHEARPGAGAEGADGHALQGAHVALLFDKPSLRTRSTFEIAVRELGGQRHHAVSGRGAWRTRTGDRRGAKPRALGQGAVIRTFAHATLQEFAKAAPRLNVINALSDQEHPCQALADFLTLQEHWGTLAGRTIAFVGDGNNVATSLAQAGVDARRERAFASPDGYRAPGVNRGRKPRASRGMARRCAVHAIR